MSKLPPPPPEAESGAKRPWSKPRLRTVNFSLKGIKSGTLGGFREEYPAYTPHIS